MPRLACVVSQFPELHETFILREFLELRRRGYELSIFSLKPCRDRIIHPEARELMAETIYSPFGLSCSVWAAQLYWLIRHPVRWLRTLGFMVWTHRCTPEQLVKLCVLWPKLLFFARIIERRRLTHLHAHWATIPASAAMIIARLLNIDWSLTAHAWDLFVENPTLTQKIEQAKFVITCTEYNRRFLASLVPSAANRIARVYHGVVVGHDQPERAIPPQQTTTQPPLILSVGRLVETKGFPYLLEACQRLKQRGRRFSCVLVGEGPNRQSLEQQIQSLGLGDCVRLAGALPRTEVQQLYRSAALFVLPSIVARNGDRDGIPNVILEAMASGLPVVSTRISGIPEAVEEGVTGFLVPERDVAALADRMERFLQDVLQARRMGEAGRRKMAVEFDDAKHMDELDRILRMQLNTRRRVAYIIWSLEVGGAERVVSLLARHLDPTRYEPFVICLNGPGVLASSLEQAGVRVIPLWKRGGVDVGMLVRLVRLIRRERIELVHTHLWGGNFWGRLAAWWTGVPAVATEHSTDLWKPSWYFFFDRWFAQWTKRLIAVSDAVRAFYVSRGIPASLCQTIPNGIDTSALPAPKRSPLYDELKWPTEAPVFVLIGRLVAAKNIELFIDAMASLIAQCPQARGLIVGDGPLRVSLEARIQERGISERVIVTGLREDIPAILRGARAVVFTSHREGLPMVLIEAMASAIPVVSTAVGGMPEVIEEGRTGWLVPPGAMQPIVERLRVLVDGPALAQRAGAAAQAVARTRWSVERMVREHEAVYQEILSPPTKVVYVIDHLDSGGAQSQLLELAKHLPRDRFACAVISLSSTKRQLFNQFHDAKIAVTAIEQSGVWSWSCLGSLIRHLRAARPHIVHTWLFTADLYGRLAARLAGVPVVISSVRSVETWKKRHYIWADRLLQHVTDAVAVNAEVIRPVLIDRDRIRAEKIRTIYNGVDLTVFSPSAANGALRRTLRLGTDPIVGLVSRLMPEKDPLTFIRAAARVAGAVPSARFLVVGDGALRDAMLNDARRSGIVDRVTLTGFRSDRAALLHAMDIIVLSSLYEGCANAILEAMAMGKPVVATDVGGNKELVIPGTTGLLVPSRDPDAMARAIISLLNNPVRARAMGLEGRRRIEQRFTVERMVEQTTALYASLT